VVRHRWLAMKLVVAVVVVAVVVVAMVGTGGVAWARGGTEPPTTFASFQTIELILVPLENRPTRVNITPLYDYARCVRRDATNPPSRTISQETVIAVGVTVLGTWATGCHINRSQMYWRLDARSTDTVTLIKPAGRRVRAECLPVARCTSPRPNAVRISV